MIAIIDYGVGNLYSLKSSLEAMNIESKVTNDKEEIKKADKIILPGVGAFCDAKKSLDACGLSDFIIELTNKKKPILGICLGMQLLFEKSYEYGEYDGLGLLKGNIIPIADVVSGDYKIPHIGWNALSFPKDKEKSPILKYVEEGDCVYFVHSYFASDCDESVTSQTEYGALLTASVGKDNIFGCQFHPEKSGKVGLSILKAFNELEA